MNSETPNIDRFHAHLDVCEQCREHPFELCEIGELLLRRVPADLPVPNFAGKV